MTLSESVHRIFLMIAVTVSIYQFAIWGLYLIRNWRNTVIQRRVMSDPSAAAALRLMYTSAQIAFLVIIVLIGLSPVS